jgi:uncharacterized Tic20 family protein
MKTYEENKSGTNMNDPLDIFDEDYHSTKDERMWATFSHLGIVAGLVIPLGSILAPLIIWLVHKDKSSYVDEHAKEALNFQLTMLIAFIISAILMIIVVGFFLMAAVGIIDLVYSIIAATKANNGEHYKYPKNLCIQFIK